MTDLLVKKFANGARIVFRARRGPFERKGAGSDTGPVPKSLGACALGSGWEVEMEA